MNKLMACLKFDLRLLKSSWKIALIMFVVVITVFIAFRNPVFLIFSSMLIATIIVSFSFIKIDKNNIDALQSTLAKRKTVLTSRYLIAFFVLLVTAIVIFFLSWFMVSVFSEHIWLNYMENYILGGSVIVKLFFVTAMMFCISALVVAVQYPLFFKFKSSNIATIAPMMIVLILFSIYFFMGMDSNMETVFAMLIHRISGAFSLPPRERGFVLLGFSGGLIITGFLLMWISTLISNQIYKRKEF
ncbi:MAG: ABC-2 transporter permease [Firmicutes bacterium]|nr:ABC-2 transporter permease [Bacillota bacterium]MCL2255754.1 ABC-2 transporter permease [Bacillota bacterium]